MTDTIEKRLTREEFLTEIEKAFSTCEKTVTFDVNYLVGLLGNMLYELQAETEERVRREMLKPSLN